MNRLFCPEDIQQFLALSPLIRNTGDSHWPTTLTLANLLREAGEDVVLQRRHYFFDDPDGGVSEYRRERVGNLVYFKWEGNPWWGFGAGTDEAFEQYIVTRIKDKQEVLIFKNFEEKQLEPYAFYHSDMDRLPHLAIWKEQCRAYCQKQVLARNLPSSKENLAKIRL